MADIGHEEDIRIDEVEMGDVTTADGILAKEKQKFEYIHGHVEHQELHVPPLEELCKVFKSALSKNFSEVHVDVVDCPNLTEKPWNLASPGICSGTRLALVGGVPYLIPVPNMSKMYTFDIIGQQVGLPNGFFIGAGAGNSRAVGTNCEMMVNVKLSPGQDNIRSKMAKVNPKDGSAELGDYNIKEFSMLADMLVSEGKQGKVIKVVAKKRKGKDNFVSCMRRSLDHHYGNVKTVGMGGVFLIEKGQAKLHVMPAFSKEALDSDEHVKEWLNFYTMDSPLTCLSVFLANDPGLDVRLEHTHCFSDHGQGGHYHYDTTPENVSYLGYFVPAEYVYRIDRPPSTHMIGRD